MKASLAWEWKLDGIAVDARLFALLRAIKAQGSLKSALASVALSYRHAWTLVTRAERDFGAPVVTMERGRGAQLTALGVRLIECDAALAPLLETAEQRANGLLAEPLPPSPSSLAVWASHDLALAQLRDHVTDDGALKLELEFHGSLDCLTALSQRRCQMAGFHVPRGTLSTLQLQQYGATLAGRDLRVLHIADRRQGIMTAPGNPRGLQGIADLATPGLRFVNRQRGAGTRLLFDQLLGAAGLKPRDIDGYTHEEHTHAAVAATVASGHADAAFGIEAAATEFGLEFVAVAEERYFLAATTATWQRPAARRFAEILRSDTFRSILESLPGYTMAAGSAPEAPHRILAAG